MNRLRSIWEWYKECRTTGSLKVPSTEAVLLVVVITLIIFKFKSEQVSRVGDFGDTPKQRFEKSEDKRKGNLE